MSTSDAGPDGAPLSIGAVAALTGKSASAIRYYERIGLLPEPARAGGRRRYDQGTVRTLAVIETAQRAGLALDEIRLLLAASPSDAAAVERLREVASRKLPEIIAQIERAELVRGWLELAARCECPDLGQCPLFSEPALPGGPAPPGAGTGKPRARLSGTCRSGARPFVQDQDRSRWDRAKISEGTRILDRAMRPRRPGPYQLQASSSPAAWPKPAARACPDALAPQVREYG